MKPSIVIIYGGGPAPGINLEDSQQDGKVAPRLVEMTSDYPRVRKVDDKDRESLSASYNRIEGYMWSENSMYRSPAYDVTHIVDGVGTGDAYAARLIYGLFSYESEQEAANFAAAACALKNTVEGDVNVVSAEDVQRIVKGNTTGKITR